MKITYYSKTDLFNPSAPKRGIRGSTDLYKEKVSLHNNADEL